MSDRGFLFLFSLAMIALGVAATGYLIATGQALTLDGLFLILTALLFAAGFALYLAYMVRRAMEVPKAPAAAAKAAAQTASKPAAVEG
jgi:hypothetical protein